MRRPILVLLSLWLCAAGAPTQPSIPGMRAGGGHRYLFLIDTSAGMAPFAGAVQQTVRHLIESGMQGQMYPGDEYVIWTYDARLHTDGFTPQTWLPEQKESLAIAAGQFVRGQTGAGRPMIYFGLIEMLKVIKASRSVTTVIINDGSEVLRGTPFDTYANTVYRELGPSLRAQFKPFATVIVAVDGRFTACAVSPGVSPIEIPHLPARLATVEPPPAPAAPAPTTPRPKAEPLILIGKRPTPPAPSAKPPAAPSTELVSPASTPEATPAASAELQKTVATAQSAPAQTADSTVHSATAHPRATPEPSATSPTATPADASTAASPVARVQASAISPAARAPSEPRATRTPTTVEVISPAVAAPPVSAPAPGPNPPAETAGPPVVTRDATPSSAPAALPPTPSVPEAAHPPVGVVSVFNRHYALIAAALLSIIAGGLLWLRLRMARLVRRGSLISRSMGFTGK